MPSFNLSTDEIRPAPSSTRYRPLPGDCFRGASVAYREIIERSHALLQAQDRVRLLSDQDTAAVVEHLQSLSEDDRVLRFSSYTSDEQLGRYAHAINYHRDVVVGGFHGEELVAFCHLAVFDTRGLPCGEVGLSVLPACRGEGLGRLVLDAALGQAAELGVTSAQINFLRRNKAMAALVQRMTDHIESDGPDCVAYIPVAPAPEHARVRRFVTAGGTEVFEGGPANAQHSVLLVHGAGGDAWQWRRRMQPFLAKQGVRSFALSLANHGDSRKCEVGSVDEYVADIRQCVTDLFVPDVVVGHSMGGYLAQKLVEQMPVSKLVLAGSVPPAGLTSFELTRAQDALHSRFARDILAKAVRSMNSSTPRPKAGKVAVFGGLSDKVIPPDLVSRTGDYYDVEPQLVPGGHVLMLNQSWQRIAQAALV